MLIGEATSNLIAHLKAPYRDLVVLNLASNFVTSPYSVPTCFMSRDCMEWTLSPTSARYQKLLTASYSRSSTDNRFASDKSMHCCCTSGVASAVLE